MRVFNFSAGPGRAAARGPRAGSRGAARLARQRHVRDGNQPSRQGVHRRRRAGRGRPARAAGDAGELQVLFLQGGATAQFAAVPMNLAAPERHRRLREHGQLVEEGASAKRSATARVNVAADAAESDYIDVPPEPTWQRSAGRGLPALHAERDDRRRRVSTSSRTRRACRWSPTCPRRSCRARSMSRVRRDLRRRAEEHRTVRPRRGHRARRPARPRAARSRRRSSTARRWRPKARCSNTPPTFGWYVAGLVFQWLKRQGGLAAMAELNRAQGRAALRRHRSARRLLPQSRRQGLPLVDERAVHAARTPSSTSRSSTRRKQAGLVDLEGHRSVGGMRASIYNAMPLEGVQALVDFMQEFADAAWLSSRMTFKILTLNNISVRGPRAAAARPLRSRLRDRPPGRRAAALGRHARDRDSRSSVLAVARAGAGTNNIPVRALSKRGIPVFNAPGANANAVKELVHRRPVPRRRATSARPGVTCAG